MKSYTLWFSILAAAAGIIQQFAPFIPPDKIGYALGIVAAITAGLHKFVDGQTPPTVPPATLRVLLPLLALCILPLGGCSILAPQIDKVAKAAGKAVTFYCVNVTDPAARETFRAQVNQYAAPNSAAIECANGTPTMRTAPAPVTK